MHVHRQQWLRAHNISSPISSIPPERTHAAEVLGDSFAITVYWSERVRSRTLIAISYFATLQLRNFAPRTLHLCVCASGVAHQRSGLRLFWPARPRLVVRVGCLSGECVCASCAAHTLGEWHARSGGSALAGPRMHVHREPWQRAHQISSPIYFHPPRNARTLLRCRSTAVIRLSAMASTICVIVDRE